jgi:NitT/TauT family transport system substrate-binding protein
MDLQKEWGKLHEGDERIPFVGLFVSEKFASENPLETKTINGLYMEGLEWVNNNPQKAAKLGEKHFGIPAKILIKSFNRLNLNYYSKRETRGLIDRYFSEIMKVYPELLGGKMPNEDFYF